MASSSLLCCNCATDGFSWHSKSIKIPQIPKNILNSLDPEYSEALQKLFFDLKTCADRKYCKVFDEFSKQYLMLPQIWELCFNFYQKSCFPSPPRDPFLKRAYSDFYQPDFYDVRDSTHRIHLVTSYKFIWMNNLRRYNKPIQDILNKCYYSITDVKNALNFPHGNLQEVYLSFECQGDQLLPLSLRKKYKDSLKLYQNFLKVETLEDKLKFIFEIGNDWFIIPSIEAMLTENPTNKWLWQTYMNFLEPKWPNIYLEVLHRYTKFFISDLEAKKLYSDFESGQAIVEFLATSNFQAPSLESFLSPIKETYRGYVNDTYPSRYYLDIPPLKNQTFEPMDKKFNKAWKTALPQKYSIPHSMIAYMTKNGTAQQRHLLNQSCKRLFLLDKAPVCCRFNFKNPKESKIPVFNKQSIVTNNWKKPLRLHIANNLLFVSSRQRHSTLLSKFIPTFWRCDARWIEIKNQNLTWNEFEFLVNPKRVLKFGFINGIILRPNSKLAAIEDVMERLPNAIEIELSNLKCTSDTTYRLQNMVQSNKLKTFFIGNLNHHILNGSIEDFIEINASKFATFSLKFEKSTPKDVKVKLQKRLKIYGEEKRLSYKKKNEYNRFSLTVH